LSQQIPLKAEGGWAYDYWFTRDGIVQVRLISNRFAMFINLWSIAFGFLILALLYRVYPFLGLILLFLCFYLPRIQFGILARRARQTSQGPPDETSTDPRLTRRFSWAEISGVTLSRKGAEITVNKKTVKARVKQPALKPLRDLLASKIGDRLKVEPETF
jgi:hypothetical protein